MYKISAQNGKEAIEYLPDGSRWMLKAKDSAYGLSVSVAAVDEAWKVQPETLDESVVPTMVAQGAAAVVAGVDGAPVGDPVDRAAPEAGDRPARDR